MAVPLFDSLTHPTLDGSWIDDRADARFATLDGQLREAGVARACAVGMAGVGGYTHAGFARACAEHPSLIPVAGLDLSAPEGLDEELAEVARLGFVGVKVHPRLSSFGVSAESLGAVFAAASARGLVVFFCTYPHGPIEVYGDSDPFYAIVGALRHAPDTRLVLLHGGDVELMRYAGLVRANDNLLLDLSFTLLAYRKSSVDLDIGWLCTRLDRRISLGSDHPQFSPRELRRRFEELAADLPPEKVRNVAHRNLATFLGVPLGAFEQ